MMFLREYDVSKHGHKIFKAYGEQRDRRLVRIHCLVEDIWGVGFKADQIAQKMGFAHDSYKEYVRV